MKRGDLVISNADDFTFESNLGVILAWVRYGGPDGTIWEVLYPDGIECQNENDLEVVCESR
jgi:hypothetical protein